MNLKKISVYISIIIIMTLLILTSYYSDQFIHVLWPFYIVPTILLVILYPYWKVAIISGIFMSGLKTFILLYIHNFSIADAAEMRLWIGGIVSWSTLVFLTYLYINLVKANRESQQLRSNLKSQNTLLATILDSMEDVVISCDADGKVNYLNNTAGYSGVILGTSIEQLDRYYTVYAEDGKTTLASTELPLYLALKGQAIYECEIVVEMKENGNKENLVVSGGPIIGTDEQITGAVVVFHNMTKWKRIEKEINRTKDQYQSLFQYNFDAVYSVDLEGNFLTLNPACEQLTGYTNEEIKKQSFHSLIHTDDLPKVIEHFEETKKGTPLNYEVTIISKSKERVMISVSNVPMIVNGNVVGVYGIAKNITQKKNLEKEVQYMAYYDQLTGLPNRTYFRNRALQGWEHSRKEKSVMAIMLLDLDGFKLVNDTLGHDIGDQVLIDVAARFKGCLDDTHLLSRMGGDEFTILLPQINEREDVVEIVRKLIKSLHDPFVFDEIPFHLSVSIGITYYNGDQHITLDTLFKQADTAMYSVKNSGKGNFSLYSEEMDTNTLMNRSSHA